MVQVIASVITRDGSCNPGIAGRHCRHCMVALQVTAGAETALPRQWRVVAGKIQPARPALRLQCRIITRNKEPAMPYCTGRVAGSRSLKKWGERV